MPNEGFSNEEFERVFNTLVFCKGVETNCPSSCPFMNGVKMGHLINCNPIVSSTDYSYVALCWDYFHDWDWEERAFAEDAVSNLECGWYIETDNCIDWAQAQLFIDDIGGLL